MKFLKIFFIVVAFLIVLLISLLENDLVLNKILQYGIKKSNQNIKIEKLSGGIFSGLSLEKINYQDSIKANLKIDLDILSLLDGVIRINDLNISNLYIDEDFLQNILDLNKTQKPQDNKKEQTLIKKIIVDKLHIDLHDLKFQEYILYALFLDIKNFYFDMKDNFKGAIELKLNSNVANLNSTIKLKNKRYHVDLNTLVKKEFIAKFTKDLNLTLLNSPNINLIANGDIKNVKLDLKLQNTKAAYNNIKVSLHDLFIDADYDINGGNLKTTLKSNINSNLAHLNLLAKSSLNINDINETLKFKTISNISIDKELLKEQNLTFTNTPVLIIKADGNLTLIEIASSLKESNITYNNIKINPKDLNLKARYHVKDQDINATLFSKINSNIANFNLTSNLKLNLHDINNTLEYNSFGEILAQKEFLKSLLPDQNLTIKKLTPLTIDLKGNFKKLITDFSFDANLAYSDLKIKSKIKNSKIEYNLLTGLIKNNLFVDINSNIAKIKLNSKAKLNLHDINNTLDYLANITIKDTKAFKDIDITSLGDISLYAKGSLKNLKATLNSKKIKADIKSNNFDTFYINLDTKKLYIGKIYNKLPKEIEDIFISLNTKGFYKLASQDTSFKIDTNINNLKLKAKANKIDNNITLSLKNSSFFADTKVQIKPFTIFADGKIVSIKELIKEINKVYPMQTPDVDGKVTFRVDSLKDSIKAQITSPTIKIQDIKLENLNFLALYQPNKITLKNLYTKTSGFKSSDLNKEIKLKKESIITFDDKNAKIDLELENLLSLKAFKQDDIITAKLKTNNLALSYPEYGKTKLTTDIEIYKSIQKLAITGEVELSESEINYKSRYLDVSKDSDIIILSKESKEKEQELKNNSFIADTFLDIKIKSKDNILYKVRAGEIEFAPNIQIRKDFSQNPKIIGKINLIGGRYDFADKRFKIDKGAIAFRGLEDINPLLDLNILYDEIEDTLIMIKIQGDKNRPKLIFSSKPMMSKKDIFSSLLFGMSASEIKNAASSANKAAEKIFGRAVAQDLARELNLDRLDINRNSDGGFDILAGKKIDKKNTLYYKNKSTKSSILLERKLSKEWSANTEIGKESQSIDFIYQKWFK